jgi:hypothetical protein
MRRRLFTLAAGASAVLCAALLLQRATGHPWHYKWEVTRTPYTFHGLTVYGHETMLYRSYDLVYLEPDRRVQFRLPYWLLVLLTGTPPLAWLAMRPWRWAPAGGTLPPLRLRPPRHARPLPRVRRRPRGEGGAGLRRSRIGFAEDGQGRPITPAGLSGGHSRGTLIDSPPGHVEPHRLGH